jgi:hypothetical protein
MNRERFVASPRLLRRSDFQVKESCIYQSPSMNVYHQQCSKSHVSSSTMIHLHRTCIILVTILIIAREPHSTTSFIVTSPIPFLTSYHYHHCKSIISRVYSNIISCSKNQQLRLDWIYSTSTNVAEEDARWENDTDKLILFFPRIILKTSSTAYRSSHGGIGTCSYYRNNLIDTFFDFFSSPKLVCTLHINARSDITLRRFL